MWVLLRMIRFSHSILNVLWILLPLGAVIFVVAFRSLPNGTHYFFDPKHNKDSRLKDAGEFGPHSQRYQDLAKLLIALAAGAIAFFINLFANDKPPTAAFVTKAEGVAPIVVGFFGCSIALLVAFMICQTVWYEEYSHSPGHDSYTRVKYAICTTLGWCGLMSFILAFCWVAITLFA
jgi:hypothetical protein